MKDKSGYGNDGILTNGANATTSGRFNGAVNFDGMVYRKDIGFRAVKKPVVR